MGDVDEEIRRAQQERLNMSKKPKGATYDDDIYGGGGRTISTSEYHTELNDDDDGPSVAITGKASRYSTESREVVRRALSSYTAPKHLLEHRPKADEKEDIDNPMQEFKRKTVAEREDEYRARWRKRKLSPPRVMAFGKDAAPTEGARSYREIMMEQQLEKEKKEVLRKIQKKKEEEEENRKRELKDRNQGTLWDVKDEGTERNANPRTSTSTSTSSSSRSSSSSSDGNWVINVMKNGQRVGDPIVLNPQTTPTFTIGRERASNLTVDHPSCSKQHATITFRNNVPQLTDLGSTNGSFINDTQLGAHKAHPVKAGDTIKFGGSTREYTLFQQ